MKLAVVSNTVPFVRGGAEELLDALVNEFRAHGHQAEPIQLAFKWTPPDRVLDHMLAARLTRLRGVDRVIALKFPAYYVPHDDKVLWLLHQFRQVYDLWGGPHQSLPDACERERVRAAVIAADNRLLPQARRIYVISPVVQERLWKFNGIPSKVLMPPIIRAETYRTDEPEGYILAAGRVNTAKRQHLLVEAMRHVRSPVKLVIAGPPETAIDAERLTARVHELGLQDRVTLILRWLAHEEKVGLLARAVAGAYLPVDEDYGYVALEALYARKPVITCTDSGGTRLVVKDELTGFVAEPEPRAVAEAIDRIGFDASLARRLGDDGRAFVDSLDISWDHVVQALTR
jgi:glycosyltransferase involved in cell wall biosynthesis